MRRRRNWLIRVAPALAAAACGAAVLAGCTSATGPTAAPSSDPSTAAVVHSGETVEVDVDGGTLQLVLDSAEVLTSCPGRGIPTQVPFFDYFLVLDLQATLITDPATPGASYAPLGAEMFRVRATDGSFQPIISTEASWECLESAQLLPAFVDNGETVSGKVVLDVATEHGSVSYEALVPVDWHWTF